MSVVKMRWLQTGEHGARDFELDGRVRRVTGAIWQPSETAAAARAPYVLLGHGASGDRYQAPLPHLAQRFVGAGIGAVAIDGPVHGLRQVGPGGREAFAKEMERADYQDNMVADWHDTVAAVQTEVGACLGRLGYFGLSMGTLFGVPLLASGLNFATSVIGLCGSTGAGRGSAARLLGDAAKIGHPTLFLVQLEDELFPRDGYFELFDALGSDDKRLHANPGLHPEVPAEEVAFAFDFLAARLLGDVERGIINPLAE